MQVERELRSKAELREKEEKTERIAACAQMAAMSADAVHHRADFEKVLTFKPNPNPNPDT